MWTLSSFAFPLLAVAAAGQESVPPTDRPDALAVRAEAGPTLDGNVLDDPAWATVPALSGFWQTTPDENAPVSERTEVRIVYTADTLYFGVVCFDREPGRIVVSESRRDAPLGDTDSFQVVLDTYHDGQNGFVFGTNPSGLEHDGQVAREGQDAPGGSFQQGGAGGGYNLNWDASWQVRSSSGPYGWSA